jgi:hypothetical protein
MSGRRYGGQGGGMNMQQAIKQFSWQKRWRTAADEDGFNCSGCQFFRFNRGFLQKGIHIGGHV